MNNVANTYRSGRYVSIQLTLQMAYLRQCCLRVMGAKSGCGFFLAPQLLITCSHVLGHAVPIGSMVGLSTLGTGGASADGDGVESGLPVQAEVLANDTSVDFALPPT